MAQFQSWGYAEGGNGNGWDKGFWRLVRYATVIGLVAFAAARVHFTAASVSASVDSLRVEVRTLSAKVTTRAEMKRLLTDINEELQENASSLKRPYRKIRLDGEGQ